MIKSYILMTFHPNPLIHLVIDTGGSDPLFWRRTPTAAIDYIADLFEATVDHEAHKQDSSSSAEKPPSSTGESSAAAAAPQEPTEVSQATHEKVLQYMWLFFIALILSYCFVFFFLVLIPVPRKANPCFIFGSSAWLRAARFSCQSRTYC